MLCDADTAKGLTVRLSVYLASSPLELRRHWDPPSACLCTTLRHGTPFLLTA